MGDSFLYVIAENSEGPCKLGISNNPEKRLRALQTGSLGKLQIYHREQVSIDKVKSFETLLHRDLHHLRLRGEWFDLSVEHAIAHVLFTIIQYDGVHNLCEKVKARRI